MIHPALISILSLLRLIASLISIENFKNKHRRREAQGKEEQQETNNNQSITHDKTDIETLKQNLKEQIRSEFNDKSMVRENNDRGIER